MSDQLWGLIFVVVIAVAIIAIIGTWLSMRGDQIANKAALARDDAYRQLAEEAVAAQRTIAAEQQKIAAELTEVRTRMSAIEKVLQEVG